MKTTEQSSCNWGLEWVEEAWKLKMRERGAKPPGQHEETRLQHGDQVAQNGLRAPPGHLNRVLARQRGHSGLPLSTSMDRKHCYCRCLLGKIPLCRSQLETQNESIYISDCDWMSHELGTHIIDVSAISGHHFRSGKTMPSVYVPRCINKWEKLIDPRAGLLESFWEFLQIKYLPSHAHPYRKLGGIVWTRHNPAFVSGRQQWGPHFQAQDVGASPRHSE